MVTTRGWVPERGDLIWLTFVPQAGREQAGRRPALVLSPAVYNGKTSLALVCPITSQPKGYPFEVTLPAGGPVGGCVLADHLKNVDWKARQAKLIGRARSDLLDGVLGKISALLGI
jgi:mRNA interferase MazF